MNFDLKDSQDLRLKVELPFLRLIERCDAFARSLEFSHFGVSLREDEKGALRANTKQLMLMRSCQSEYSVSLAGASE